MTEQRIRRLQNKIRAARARLIREKPFFGVLLMYMKFVAVSDIKKMSTNGSCIYFCADFADKLFDDELDFLLCHELLHILRGDILNAVFDGDETFHHACNYIVNSQLFLLGWTQDKYAHLGVIYRLRDLPDIPDDVSPQDILYDLPYRMSSFDESIQQKMLPDSDKWWGKINDFGQNGTVIIDVDENTRHSSLTANSNDDLAKVIIDVDENTRHSSLLDDEGLGVLWQKRAAAAAKMFPDTLQGLKKKSKTSQDYFGFESELLRRIAANMRKPQIDWRRVLDDFISEQISDYSFSPPDKRFDDTGFFLPDFNEKDFAVKDLLFMVDTSRSVNDNVLGAVYSEICGAVEQFGGKLNGKLGFFDTAVAEPKAFESVGDIMSIVPYGGGGTDFRCIFDYVCDNYSDFPPSCIIIFTDGEGEYPTEDRAMKIPVLWVLDNNNITVPWGNSIIVDSLTHKKRL